MKRQNTRHAKRIWREHFGPIPRDSDGRSCEIHHIDGDPQNDDIDNLICLTIYEHYDIHFWQEDWGACFAIAGRLKVSPEELSILTTQHNLKMVVEGTHPFAKRTDGSSLGAEVSRRLVAEGKHNFIGSPYAAQMYADGTHPFIGGEIQRATNTRRVENGTHNLLGDKNPSHERVKNGTHHMQGPSLNLDRLSKGTHVSQLRVCCMFCHRDFDKANFNRSHGDKCKHKM